MLGTDWAKTMSVAASMAESAKLASGRAGRRAPEANEPALDWTGSPEDRTLYQDLRVTRGGLSKGVGY